MSLNLETKTAYHYFDEFGMLVVKGDFADYIEEHYQDGDDTFSIHDWLEQFNQNQQ